MFFRQWFSFASPGEGAVASSTGAAASSSVKSYDSPNRPSNRKNRPQVEKGFLVQIPARGGKNGLSSNEDNFPRSPRSRINSRDIPRTYSGLYGDSGDGDLLPLECHRLQSSAIFTKNTAWCFLGNYACLLVICLLVTEQITSEPWQAWTLTNAIHLAVNLVHFHWLKGNMADPQGELGALTLWEQLEALGEHAERVRLGLRIAHVLLCYAACQFSNYNPEVCFFNLVLLAVALLAKSSFMIGVRLFNINRTVGIDDDDDEDEVDDEDTPVNADSAVVELKKKK